MKRILFPVLGLLFIFFTACKNADKKNAGGLSTTPTSDSLSNTPRAKADSLYDELLKEHDKGMKGWMRIEGKQKQIKTLLDSIASLPAKVQSSMKAFRTKLVEAKGDLGNAYEIMDNWMKEMNLDSAENNAELRIKYLTSEKSKGSQITAFINSSLQMADSLLKVKF